MARQSYDAGSAFPSVNNAAAGAVGPGTEVIFMTYGNGELPYGFTWQTVVGGGGTFSALSVTLEASLDGVNWAAIDTSTTKPAGELKSITSAKHLMLRANYVSSTTASGSPTLSVYIIA